MSCICKLKRRVRGVTTTLRQYCEAKHEPDRFLIHHGNLSASYRKRRKLLLKDEEQYQTTVTTATLELGIDIGRLERAFQIDAPFMYLHFCKEWGVQADVIYRRKCGLLFERRFQRQEQWLPTNDSMDAAAGSCSDPTLCTGAMG